MINEEFKGVIIDFVARAEEIPNLVGIILFGSAVTGEVSRKSDIDLLLVFDCEHNPEVGEESRVAHRIASDILSKYDLPYSFSFVMINQRRMEGTEPDFLWNMARTGILIWGRPRDLLVKEPLPSLEPLLLISYSLKGLREKDRRGLLRALYSYKKRRAGSLIDKKEEKLAPGVILIRGEKLEEVKNIFAKFGLQNYSVKRLWGH